MTKIQLSLAFLLISFISKGQDFYDISNVNTIELTFFDSDWDAIMDQYYDNDLDERLVASCIINGVQFDSVGVKYKGNSTYNVSNTKNPLNIKLDYVYNQDYQGFETLKLANGDKDPSFVREVLGYEIGRKYMDMPLSNYTNVYINGDLYGLYNNTESINGDYMERRFYCNGDNTRIKCNPVYGTGGNGPSLEYLGTDTSLYYNFYEIKSDFGWTDLMNFTDNLSNNLANIEDYLDVDRALWMLAFNNVLINLDTYTGPIRQNYYMILDDNGRFLPVIWDLNGCFGAFTAINGGPGSPVALSDLTDMDPYLREGEALWPLISQLYNVPRYRKQYMAHCRTIYEENLANGDYYTRGQEIQAVIGNDVQADPNAFYPYTQFINNLTSSVGGGPGLKYGVAEIEDGRASFLSSYADYNFTQPTISSITNSPLVISANTTITFTADIQDVNYAYLGYRSYKADAFQKVEMFDDGAHGDGAAADGVWGTSITIGSSDIQYYIYAENTDAGKFSPVRAEHEFYELTLSGDVVINEIMPSNNVTAADQDGEYNDWIELYNNTSSTVDLSGYYLSDSIQFPTKWIIPDGTTIAANDYLIIWADNDILQNGLHANFKLSSSGETIVFSDASAQPINTVTYAPVSDNNTYGRFPNGTGGFIPMVPTYNAENSYTAVSVEELVESSDVILFPNPATDYIQIQFDLDEAVDVQVFDLQGRLIENSQLMSNEEISTSEWQSGIYIVYIPEMNWTGKVVVR